MLGLNYLNVFFLPPSQGVIIAVLLGSVCALVRAKASEFCSTVPVWGGMSYGSRKDCTWSEGMY